MPTNKDFKRLVRARMLKTGEAYTTARSQILRRAQAGAPAETRPSPAEASPPSIETRPSFEARAGIRDAAIEKRTGCTWEKWVFVLDKAGAADWSHRAIAEHVHRTYKVSDWWAQTVTVGYERIKGRREIGQRVSGAFEATRSKTIAAAASKISRAFTDSRQRRKWLPEPAVTIRKAVQGKSVRMSWPDDTSVEVWLTTKGPKTAVQIAHRKLAGREDVERRKVFWGARLAALQQLLEAR
jgi:hypothetical protein